MRIGTVIFFGLVMVFLAGFLFSNNVQARTEVKELQEAQSALQVANQALKTENHTLTTLLDETQVSLTEAEAANLILSDQNEALTRERDEAQGQASELQETLEHHRAICTQTNPFAAILVTLNPDSKLPGLAETASIPGMLILVLALTTASGGGWYWWRHTHHPTWPPLPKKQHDEVWVRMTRQQARQFVRFQRQEQKI